MTKLSTKDFLYIKDQVDNYYYRGMVVDLAKEFGVSHSLISRIRHGSRVKKTHTPDK